MSWHHVEDRTVTARKRHQCQLCGCYIEPGWRYISRFGYDEDGPLRGAMHIECEASTKDWDSMDWECHMTGDGDWPKYNDSGEVESE